MGLFCEPREYSRTKWRKKKASRIRRTKTVVGSGSGCWRLLPELVVDVTMIPHQTGKVLSSSEKRCLSSADPGPGGQRTSRSGSSFSRTEQSPPLRSPIGWIPAEPSLPLKPCDLATRWKEGYRELSYNIGLWNVEKHRYSKKRDNSKTLRTCRVQRSVTEQQAPSNEQVLRIFHRQGERVQDRA